MSRKVLSAVMVLGGAWIGTAAIIDILLFGKTGIAEVIIAVSFWSVMIGRWIGRPQQNQTWPRRADRAATANLRGK